MNFVECHEEPIHIPGYIQSFGYLIGIDADSHSITFFSKNIEDIFSVENLNQLFGKKLTDFPESFASIIESDIYSSLPKFTRRENETYYDKIFISGQEYHFSVFKSKDIIFLEFEKVLLNPNKRISNKYDNFYIIDDYQEIWDQLLTTLSIIVHYDSMMICHHLGRTGHCMLYGLIPVSNCLGSATAWKANWDCINLKMISRDRQEICISKREKGFSAMCIRKRFLF